MALISSVSIATENNSSCLVDYPDELIKWTLLKAEQKICVGDGSFSDYADLWAELTAIISKVKERELQAKADYLRFKAIQLGLKLLLRTDPTIRLTYISEAEAWLKAIGKYIYSPGVDWPWSDWSLRPEIWWKLSEAYNDLSISDDMAWEAASEGLLYECEGDLACEMDKINSTYLHYLELFPKGKYYRLALERVYVFLSGRMSELEFKKLKVSEFGQEELISVKNEANKMHNILVNVHKANKDEYSYEVLKIFETAFSEVLGDKNMVLNIRGGKIDGKKSIFYVRPTLTISLLNYPLEYFVNMWKKLEKQKTEEPNAAGYVKLMKFLCLKKMVSLISLDQLKASGIIDEEANKYIKGGQITAEALLELHEKYKSYPVADDIAFSIVRQRCLADDGVYYVGSSVYRNLIFLNKTEGQYLELHPDGKYVPLVLDNIINVLKGIRGDSSLKLAYYLDDDVELISEEAKKLERVLKNCRDRNKTLQKADQALEEFYKTFNNYKLTLN